MPAVGLHCDPCERAGGAQNGGALKSLLSASVLALMALGCDDGADESAADAAVPPVTDKLDTGGTYFESLTLGAKVTGLEELGESIEYAPDGSIELDGEAVVEIEGQGKRAVLMLLSFDTVANGGRQTLLTVDLETDEERVMHYEPEDNALVIGDMEGGVFLFGNPDGSYDVVTSLFDEDVDDALFEHAEDGYAAWQLLQEYNQFTSTSNFSLMLAYAAAQRLAPDARGIGELSGPKAVDSPSSPGDPICRAFADLCDCIACQASGKGAACSLCEAP